MYAIDMGNVRRLAKWVRLTTANTDCRGPDRPRIDSAEGVATGVRYMHVEHSYDRLAGGCPSETGYVPDSNGVKVEHVLID